MIRKNIILVLVFVLLAGCEKDDDTITKGKILFTTEKHQSPEKTSVEGTTVQWVNDDLVRLYVGGSIVGNYGVTVDGSNAYTTLDKGGESDSVRAYYPTSIITASGAMNGNTNAPTVVIPNRYDSYFSGSRQVLSLPMVAKGVKSDNKIEFKQLTAAIQVEVKNETGSGLTLDSVVVYSNDYLLSDTMKLDLSKSDYGIKARTSVSLNSVTVRFSDDPSIAANGTITVQVPIRPIGETAKPLGIEVYAHRLADTKINIDGVPKVYKTKVYHYNDAKNVSSLGRNIMMTARIALSSSGHTSTDEIDNNSLFTIDAEGHQVRFSKGNLRATTTDGGSNWSWTLADNQYDYIGSATANKSINGAGTVSTNGTVDLFGWVGAHSSFIGAAIYGIHNSTTNSDYGNTSGEALKSDWGTRIGDGWRTLTSSEWDYLLKSRPGNRFLKACVNGVNGLVIFSDAYRDPTGVTALNHSNHGQYTADYSATFTISQWNAMEAAGAVFLPAAGYRDGATVGGAAGEGDYWSSSCNGSEQAKRLEFKNNELYTANGIGRHYGYSVRLVKSN